VRVMRAGLGKGRLFPVWESGALASESLSMTIKSVDFDDFLTRDVIYTSRAYAMMSVFVCLSVCDVSALWSRCMSERGEGSSRVMIATARPSCLQIQRAQYSS